MSPNRRGKRRAAGYGGLSPAPVPLDASQVRRGGRKNPRLPVSGQDPPTIGAYERRRLEARGILPPDTPPPKGPA